LYLYFPSLFVICFFHSLLSLCLYPSNRFPPPRTHVLQLYVLWRLASSCRDHSFYLQRGREQSVSSAVAPSTCRRPQAQEETTAANVLLIVTQQRRQLVASKRTELCLTRQDLVFL
jgi:hypothetical protein